jgi:hypothetical protein
MKPVFLLTIFAVALCFAACNTDSAVDPVTSQQTAINSQKTSADQDVLAFDPLSARDIDARLRLELQKMTRILGLTPRQQAAVAELLKKQYAAEIQLRRQHQNDPVALRKALIQLQTRIDNAIMQLLTKEQLVKWRLWKNLSTRNG